MVQNMPDDGRIGKEIDWSLVIPSITRPVWEPPALEVLDSFEGITEGFSFNLNDDVMKAFVPDPELRLGFVDKYCEMASLAVYRNWADETLKAAEEVANQEKVAFYESLLEALEVDFKEVKKECILWIRTWDALYLVNPLTEEETFHMSDTEDGEEGSGDELDTSNADSSHPSATTNDENSMHSSAEVSITANLPSSPVNKTATPDSSQPKDGQSAGTSIGMAHTLPLSGFGGLKWRWNTFGSPRNRLLPPQEPEMPDTEVD